MSKLARTQRKLDRYLARADQQNHRIRQLLAENAHLRDIVDKSGWKQAVEANNAIVAAVLKHFGCDKDAPANINVDDVKKAVTEIEVKVAINGDGYSLHYESK